MMELVKHIRQLERQNRMKNLHYFKLIVKAKTLQLNVLQFITFK